MRYNFSKSLVGGLALLLFSLLVLETQSCSVSNRGSIIEIYISDHDNSGECRIDLCYIKSFEDLYNGSEALVIASNKLSCNGKTTFYYNPSKFQEGVLRFNVFNNENINSPLGSIIKKGSKSNYIFFFPEIRNKSEISLNIDSIQCYNVTNCTNVNSEYFESARLLNEFNSMIDKIALEIEERKNLYARDSIIYNSFTFLKDQYSENANELLNKEYINTDVKLFCYHYFLSEFYETKDYDKIVNRIKDDQDFLNIKDYLLEYSADLTKNQFILSDVMLDIFYGLQVDIETINKPILVDIWASWCGPCRIENRTILKEINDQYNAKVNLLSISVDKDSLSWRNAVEIDEIDWTSIILPANMRPLFVKEFDIKEYPSKILIISKNRAFWLKGKGADLFHEIEQLTDDNKR